MDKELEIVTPLDQAIYTDNLDILAEVENRISLALESQDLDNAFGFCVQMIGNMKRSGIALAKALWMIKDGWEVFMVGDEFEPTAQHYIGLHPHTIERYVKVWEMLTKHVPKQLREEIQQKNIKSLIPIANAIAQGFEIENNTWEKLADAADFNEISRIVREEVKEENPRKNNLTIKIDGRGSLWAYHTDQKLFIGSLELYDENPIVQKAIERIISNSGILKG